MTKNIFLREMSAVTELFQYCMLKRPDCIASSRMQQQHDLVEEPTERGVFIRLPLEAGQHGAGDGCHELFFAVCYRAQFVERDLGAERADELAVLRSRKMSGFWNAKYWMRMPSM